jgi:hypothetical protein
VNQWRKGIARWTCGRTLYLSVPFTWLLDDARRLAEAHSGKVVAGGPAVKLMGAPWASETPDECPFDVLAMHNPCATFTTRGCPNRCGFFGGNDRGWRPDLEFLLRPESVTKIIEGKYGSRGGNGKPHRTWLDKDIDGL